MMLQTIRERASGLVLWVIAIVITLSFALFGVNSYFQSGRNIAAIKIDGEEIDLQTVINRFYQRRSEEERELPVGSRGLSSTRLQELQEEVVEGLINEELSRLWAVRSSVITTDARVAHYIRNEVPAFQYEGKFNRAAYQSYVRSQGYSEPYFENVVLRTSLATYEMQQALLMSGFDTLDATKEMLARQDEKRDFSYLLIDPERFHSEITLTDEAIAAEYEANKEDYIAPERARFEYLVLDTEALIKSETEELDIASEDIAARYEVMRDTYVTEETRQVRHILLSTDNLSDEERDTLPAQIAQIRADIVEGTLSFEEAAKRFSQDTATAEFGGNLGFFGRGMMVDDFEAVAFSLAEGELSEPVQTEFGYHLLRVDTISPSETEPLEVVSEQIERDLKLEKAQQLLIDKADHLANLVWEMPDSLEPAAEEMGLEVIQTDYLERDDTTGPLRYYAVSEAAFSPELIESRTNSDVITVSNDRRIVIRVVEYQPTEQRTLEQVRSELSQKLTAEAASKKAEEFAQTLIGELEKGASLAELSEQNDLSEPQSITTTRSDRALPAEIIEAAFTLLPTEQTTLASVTSLSDGSAALIHLFEVKREESYSASELRDYQQMMSYGRATEELDAVRSALREQAKIVIKEDLF